MTHGNFGFLLMWIHKFHSVTPNLFPDEVKKDKEQRGVDIYRFHFII